MKGEMRLLSDDMVEAVVAAESYSFGVPRENVPAWLERAGRRNVRVWFAGGRVAGSAIVIPMGIWFGARSVKNLGIAGVAVGPEDRGKGYGYELMAEIMREGRRDGFAVTTLYPATLGLYRKVGYELGGGHYTIRLPLDGSTPRAREGEIVAVGLADVERLRPVQSRLAAANNGNLDRGPYVWARINGPRMQATRGFAVAFDGVIEGHLFLQQRGREIGSNHHDLILSDFVAGTPRAMRRLLSFLGEHRSIVKIVQWTGHPHDPFLSLLPEKTYEVKLEEHWMLRILDVKAAFEGRGYVIERATSVELEIEDREVSENSGRVRLDVEEGVGRVSEARGGPVIRGRIGAISALYTGYRSASQLAAMGWIEGDQAALSAADRIFDGRTPWMSEMF